MRRRSDRAHRHGLLGCVPSRRQAAGLSAAATVPSGFGTWRRGQEVARLEGHTNYVFSLAFSPDGTSLASGSGDGTVRIWDTESPALRHQARREAEALRPEAERLVARLFSELREPDQVVARLRADTTLSDLLRHMAVREVMRRGQQATP